MCPAQSASGNHLSMRATFHKKSMIKHKFLVCSCTRVRNLAVSPPTLLLGFAQYITSYMLGVSAFSGLDVSARTSILTNDGCYPLPCSQRLKINTGECSDFPLRQRRSDYLAYLGSYILSERRQFVNLKRIKGLVDKGVGLCVFGSFN